MVEADGKSGKPRMKQAVWGALWVVVTYLILLWFGWVGLLISLPIFFAAPFLVHWMKRKWIRRNSLP